MRVFISHSSADESLVRRLTKALAERGVEVWTAEDIQPGMSWTAAIKSAIEDADVIVPVLSSESEKSHSVSSEISLALADYYSGARKVIIPVLADPKAEAPFFLKDFQWVDLSSTERFNENLDRLVIAIQRGREDTPPFEIWAARGERLKAEKELCVEALPDPASGAEAMFDGAHSPNHALQAADSRCTRKAED